MTNPIFTEALAKVFNYYSNPQANLDFDTIKPYAWWDHEKDERVEGFRVAGRTFEQATGFTKLGEGHYSCVYRINEDYVLKIVKRSDSGYARYVNLLKPENFKYAPKVFFDGKIAGKDVYILEALSEEPYGVRSKFASAINMLCDDSQVNPFVTCGDPEMQAFVEFLVRNNLVSDCRRDNVLARRDGTPVLTDPCSENP